MKKFILLLCITFNAYAFDEATVQKLQTAIDMQTAQKTHVGIALGIIENGQTKVLTSGYGDLAAGKLLSGSEYFSIGSVTKTFTSLLLAHAVYAGKVKIDDKVESLLPEYTGLRVGSITLRQLSTHTSGIQRDPNELSSNDIFLPFENFTYELLHKELLAAKFKEVKDEEVYSNLGIALLGLCLEEIYNTTYVMALRDNILKPLGLEGMLVYALDSDLPLISKKYYQTLKKLPLWMNLGYMNPAGSIKAPVHLMLKYIQAQLQPETTPLESVIKLSQTSLHDFKKESIGYGWFLHNEPVGRVLYHNGSTAGHATDVFIGTDSKKGLVVFSNTGAKVECVAAIFMMNKECTPNTVAIDEDDILNDLAAIYKSNNPLIFLNIENTVHGFLTLQVIGQPTGVRLFKLNPDEYYFFNGNGLVKFIRNSAGDVESLDFFQKVKGKWINYQANKLTK